MLYYEPFLLFCHGDGQESEQVSRYAHHGIDDAPDAGKSVQGVVLVEGIAARTVWYGNTVFL